MKCYSLLRERKGHGLKKCISEFISLEVKLLEKQASPITYDVLFFLKKRKVKYTEFFPAEEHIYLEQSVTTGAPSATGGLL